MKRFWLGLVLAASLLAVLLAWVDTARLLRALGNASPLPILFAISLAAVAMLLKAWRWGLAIQASSGVRAQGVVPASFVGFAANLLVPARLGEIARVFVLRRHVPVSRVLTLTSAAVGQLLDLATLVLLLGLLALWGGTAGLIEPLFVVLGVVAALSVLALLVLVHHHQERVAPLVARVGRWLPDGLGRRLGMLFGNTAKALGVLQDRKVLAAMLAFTLGVWTLEALAVASALDAFGVSVGAGTVLLLMTALNLAFLVPLTPGNMGTHQLVSVLVLGSVGIEGARAVAFSIGLQGSLIAFTLIAGATCLYFEGLDLATLRAAGTRESIAKN